MEQTNLIGATLYVRKLVSLSPDRFDYINLDEALDRYHEYLVYFTRAHAERIMPRDSIVKNFEEWLNTEI